MPEGKSPLQQGALRHEHLGCGVAGRAPGRLSPLAPVGTRVVAAHGYAEERMVPPDPPCRRQRSRSRPEPGRATMRHGEGEEGAERVRLAASRWQVGAAISYPYFDPETGRTKTRRTSTTKKSWEEAHRWLVQKQIDLFGGVPDGTSTATWCRAPSRPR